MNGDAEYRAFLQSDEYKSVFEEDEYLKHMNKDIYNTFLEGDETTIKDVNTVLENIYEALFEDDKVNSSRFAKDFEEKIINLRLLPEENLKWYLYFALHYYDGYEISASFVDGTLDDDVNEFFQQKIQPQIDKINLSPLFANITTLYSNVPKDMIIEWISVQSIMKGDNAYEFKTPLADGEIDECEAETTANCKYNEKCRFYKNKCTKISRVTTYEDGVISSLTGEKFDIIATHQFHGNAAIVENSPIYLKILKSHASKNMFFFFPFGESLNGPGIEDDIQINGFLREKVIEYCLADYKEGETTYKYIFCGHSMGSMLAQLCGLMLFRNTETRSFFENNCFVLGSGPIPWMKNRNDLYSNLPNVYMFVLVSLNGDDGCDIDNVTFPYRSLKNYLYKPMLMIVYDLKHSTFMFPDQLQTNKLVTQLVSKQIISKKQSFGGVHAWSAYHKTFDNLRHAFEGGGRKKRKMKRVSRRRKKYHKSFKKFKTRKNKFFVTKMKS